MLENFLNNKLLKIRNRHFLFLDCLFLFIGPFLALQLRLDGQVEFDLYLNGLVWCTVVFLIIDILVFYKLGLYNRYWNSASIDELAKLIYIIFWAVTIQTTVFVIFHHFNILSFTSLPLSIPLLNGVISFFFVTGTRFSIRLIERLNERKKISFHGERVLIVGSGKAGNSIVQEMQRNPQLGLNPVAFVDDDITKKG
jgi:FlaA1/EpsC-like NDP-sugar epimerase